MEEGTYFDQLWSELKQTIKLMVLTVPTQLLITLPSVLCYMLAGHVSNDDFDAVGLGQSFLNAVALSSSNGMAIACEIFLSQANGSSRRSSLGLVVQRCLVISLILFLLVASIVVHFPTALAMFGKSATFVNNVRNFMYASLPGLLGFSVMMVEMKYLQCQKIVKPCVIIGIIVNILHLGYALPLTVWSGLGAVGSGLSLSITYWIWSLMLFGYIRLSDVYKETWRPWSVESLQHWKRILKTAVPSIVMVSLELVCLELFTVLSTILGKRYLSIFLIPINIFYIAYNMEYGGATAVTIQIGNYLGQGDYKNAEFSALTSKFLALGVSLFDVVIIIALYYVIPNLYSSDEFIIAESRPLVIMIALAHFFDANFYIVGGIIRACNRQTFLTLMDLMVFGFIGIPLACCLMFWASLNDYGIVIALIVSLFLLACIVFARSLFFDWKIEAIYASTLVKETTLSMKNNDSIDTSNKPESQQLIKKDNYSSVKFVFKWILIFTIFVTLFCVSLIGSFLY